MATFQLQPPSAHTPTRLGISGDLTLYEASEARDELLALLPTQPCPWELDLGALAEIDSAGIQLLLALHKTLSLNGQHTRIIALAEPARALVELLRLDVLYPSAGPALHEG